MSLPICAKEETQVAIAEAAFCKAQNLEQEGKEEQED